MLMMLFERSLIGLTATTGAQRVTKGQTRTDAAGLDNSPVGLGAALLATLSTSKWVWSGLSGLCAL